MALLISASADQLAAQSASKMWGTTASGAGGAFDFLTSSQVNEAAGNVAAQSEAAKKGYLLPDNVTINSTSISAGTYAVTTITGNNNSVTQTGINKGAVSSSSTVSVGASK